MATEDATVLQKMVDSESKNEEENLVGGNESECHVLQYWKSFNVKAVVDLLVSCWNEVTPTTINHTWRNLLGVMPEDRKVRVPGEPQTVEAEVEVAVLEARHIPWSGFA